MPAKEGGKTMTESNTEVETWTTVPGFSIYQMSHPGQIRSTDRETPDGRKVRGRVLKPSKSNRGYLLVHVTDDAGKVQTRTVHTLMMLTFAGPCPPGQQVRHLNDDPEDNRLENLAYGTAVENAQDKFANGAPRAVRTPPKACVRCGQPVDKGGRRCHACVVEIGQHATGLLAAGVPLDQAAEKLDYPSLSGLHTLARKYGGYGVPQVPPEPTPQPRPSRGVMATLRHIFGLSRGR
jgi:hypothetical protein